MGMNRHDAYYEPEDDYNDQEELEHEAWKLTQKGGDYDYQTPQAIAEMMSELDIDMAKDLQAMIDTGDFEKIGRKIMCMTEEFMERQALSSLGAPWL